MFLVIIASLILPLVGMGEFWAQATRYMSERSEADEWNADLAEDLASNLNEVEGLNKSILALWESCTLAMTAPPLLTALRAEAEVLRTEQELLLAKIRTRTLLVLRRGVFLKQVSGTRSPPGPCLLPGIIGWSSLRPLFEFRESFAGFRVEKESAVWRWHFYQPEVQAL